MRPNLASDPAYAAAVRDFIARLARAGVAVPRAAAADACILLDAARTRGEILAAAGAIAGFLAGKDVVATRDQILEGAAAFRGLRSWDALSAKAPRALGPATVKEQEDVLPLLLREDGGPALPNGEPILWSYRTAAGPESLQVIITPCAVLVVEGHGLHQRILDSHPVTGPHHRKEADWEANRLAERWLIDVPLAARLLAAAGFAVVGTGGGLTAWARDLPDRPGASVLITDAEGATHRVGVRETLLVGLRGDAEDLVVEAAGLAEALDAIPGLLAPTAGNRE